MTCDSRDSIIQGADGPYHLRFDITNDEQTGSDVDFTDVISTEFQVLRPDGTQVVWPGQVESVSVTAIRVAYEFLDGDLDQVGEYKVSTQLALVVGELFARQRRFTVQPQF